MKLLHVFNFWDRLQAGLLKEILASEGIECILRNDQLSSAIGEIPFTECCPELWIIDDETYPRAKLLLNAWLKSESSSEKSWQCPVCSERCPDHFGACWSCGSLREEEK